MRLRLKKLLEDDSAATAIEYGLIAAIMGVVLVASYGALSGSLVNVLTTVSNHMADSN